jgi:hypothetical protein
MQSQFVYLIVQKREISVFLYPFLVLKLKKLHDLLVLKITQGEGENLPLAQIIGRIGVHWESEFPVDRGWIDIWVPRQKGIEQPYVIEVETGYDFNCATILQKFERFKLALIKPPAHFGGVIAPGTYPKMCVIIPPDFDQFIPLFKAKNISVFLWKGNLEWNCKKCKKTALHSSPWKPKQCSSCKSNERSLNLVNLKDFEITEAYRVS